MIRLVYGDEYCDPYPRGGIDYGWPPHFDLETGQYTNAGGHRDGTPCLGDPEKGCASCMDDDALNLTLAEEARDRIMVTLGSDTGSPVILEASAAFEELQKRNKKK